MRAQRWKKPRIQRTSLDQIVSASNVRGWSLPEAFGPVVNLMSFSFGSKETYLFITAVSIWREGSDPVELFIEG
jgi:hypothetical protein